ncbi:hypothetical protein LXL04_020025 [Taraxacum kok-saghyz]
MKHERHPSISTGSGGTSVSSPTIDISARLQHRRLLFSAELGPCSLYHRSRQLLLLLRSRLCFREVDERRFAVVDVHLTRSGLIQPVKQSAKVLLSGGRRARVRVSNLYRRSCFRGVDERVWRSVVESSGEAVANREGFAVGVHLTRSQGRRRGEEKETDRWKKDLNSSWSRQGFIHRGELWIRSLFLSTKHPQIPREL